MERDVTFYLFLIEAVFFFFFFLYISEWKVLRLRFYTFLNGGLQNMMYTVTSLKHTV